MPTDPYTDHDATGLGGGDGSDYFVILPPEPLLIRAFLTLEKARVEALKNVNPAEGRVRAGAISLVISQVSSQVDAAAALTATAAEGFIVDRINATQKRPDPPGKGSGTRLKDAVRCRPLPTPLAGGAVGIGEIGTLDQVADAQGRAYWRAQEFGSTHLVGRTITGFFQPGGAAPDKSSFRQHPIFQVDRGGFPMHIENPIPERAFLREGAALAEFFRQKELGNAVSGGIKDLQAIVSGTAPILRRIRRVVR